MSNTHILRSTRNRAADLELIDAELSAIRASLRRLAPRKDWDDGADAYQRAQRAEIGLLERRGFVERLPEC